MSGNIMLQEDIKVSAQGVAGSNTLSHGSQTTLDESIEPWQDFLSPKDYLITNLGFLPESCCSTLPAKWDHLQPLLDHLDEDDSQKFRDIVHSMPRHTPELYSVDGLTQSEKLFLYSILAMCMQKYLWGKGTSGPVDTIPIEIGGPLMAISKEFNIIPALTYLAVIVLNWSLKDKTQPLTIENLKVNHRMAKTFSFDWFCFIHIAIENEGGKVLIPISNIHKNMKENDIPTIKETLRNTIEVIKNTNVLLSRMYENCTPEDFWTFRFYFEGTNDTTFFPEGLKIQGYENEPVVIRGASGGQSPLMQVFDALFSVDHVGHGRGFLDEMRDYMLPSHRRFLEDLSKGPKLKKFVESSGDEELQNLFIEGVDTFTAYRQYHYRVAHDYIFRLIKSDQIDVPVQKKKEENKLYKQNKTGTGGTEAPRFLKQTIQFTKEARNISAQSEAQADRVARFDSIQGLKTEKVKFSVSIQRERIEDFLLSFIIAVIGSYILKRFLL